MKGSYESAQLSALSFQQKHGKKQSFLLPFPLTAER